MKYRIVEAIISEDLPSKGDRLTGDYFPRVSRGISYAIQYRKWGIWWYIHNPCGNGIWLFNSIQTARDYIEQETSLDLDKKSIKFKKAKVVSYYDV